MKLRDMLIVDQSNTIIKGLARERVGILLTVERELERVSDSAISWRTETAETGFVRALRGKRRDALRITHKKLPEYTVVVCAQPHGKVLHVAWMVLAAPRLRKDLRRALRLATSSGERFEVGSELDVFDVMDLKAFLGITRLALQDALRALTDDKDALAHELSETL